MGSIIFFCLLLTISFRVKAQTQPAAEPLLPLSAIRDSVLAESEDKLIGKKVTVRGVANISTGMLHERFLQIYIQNDSSGLSLFRDSFDEPIATGDSVVATGEMQKYLSLTELHVQSYKVTGKSPRMPGSLRLRTVIDQPDKFEGMLVSGQGVILGKGRYYNGKYLSIAPDDTSRQTILVYVSNFHRYYEEFDFDKLSIGDNIKVTGILSRHETNPPATTPYKIFVRTPSDLEYVGIPMFYIWWIFAFVGAGIFVALIWYLMLKVQISKRTDVITTSLREKESLLQEIHHRVKNNMAIISGLIELQLDTTKDKEALRVLRDSQVRIQAMALVHEKLYQSASLSSVEMDVYIKELVEAIHQTFASDRSNVEIVYQLDPVKLGIERVIPCGLLINELVVNAFKHAFNEEKAGRLVISLSKANGKVEMTVTDNGPGLSKEFSTGGSDSLGMLLIQTFASQLSAEMEIESNGGTSFAFQFSTDSEKAKPDST